MALIPEIPTRSLPDREQSRRGSPVWGYTKANKDDDMLRKNGYSPYRTFRWACMIRFASSGVRSSKLGLSRWSDISAGAARRGGGGEWGSSGVDSRLGRSETSLTTTLHGNVQGSGFAQIDQE